MRHLSQVGDSCGGWLSSTPHTQTLLVRDLAQGRPGENTAPLSCPGLQPQSSNRVATSWAHIRTCGQMVLNFSLWLSLASRAPPPGSPLQLPMLPPYPPTHIHTHLESVTWSYSSPHYPPISVRSIPAPAPMQRMGISSPDQGRMAARTCGAVGEGSAMCQALHIPPSPCRARGFARPSCANHSPSSP